MIWLALYLYVFGAIKGASTMAFINDTSLLEEIVEALAWPITDPIAIAKALLRR